ncbi:MAG: transporter [Bacteroidia bacterium]|nr:transporter [Bacteroidia bacterium]
MLNRSVLLVICFLIGFSGIAQVSDAELGPLITDRPDATESPNVVPVGFLQVETGMFYESYKDEAVKSKDFTLNTTLIRMGLIKNVELRLGWDFIEGRTELNGNELDDISSGFSPLLAGVKIHIAEEKNGFPQIGLIGHVNLPFTAGKDYKPETTSVDFRFAFSHTLSESTNLSYNIGAAWEGDNPEAAMIYTIAYGFGIINRLGGYVELYGDLPENSSANHLWDAGFTYLVSDSFQLDATVGTSLTEGQDILLSAGASFRIPLKSNQVRRQEPSSR